MTFHRGVRPRAPGAKPTVIARTPAPTTMVTTVATLSQLVVLAAALLATSSTLQRPIHHPPLNGRTITTAFGTGTQIESPWRTTTLSKFEVDKDDRARSPPDNMCSMLWSLFSLELKYGEKNHGCSVMLLMTQKSIWLAGNSGVRSLFVALRPCEIRSFILGTFHALP